MRRYLQTTLPQVDDHLQPQWKYLETLNKQFKEKRKIDFDCQHQVRPLPSIPDDTQRGGHCGGGQLRRNRHYLNVIQNSIQ